MVPLPTPDGPNIIKGFIIIIITFKVNIQIIIFIKFINKNNKNNKNNKINK
jgi:hypothetical protein